ncbi:tRNA uridine-5-carboxymethylaminomethyl(34) synthesis GTPase MnmE [Helicobacter sp. MIT 00-7814]|nr:tRNA uridine-5-carboxymethylaminomethyl(34) synthesis GTPase MnmE [Helicobacter sp. MIT 99-10781]RDU54071.1 tRNA uridine-5-carboxymethylaminomethyl(34) synthesis GTPase MnmE [Helicobacter sp. MIT 00-7814]
MTSDASNSPAFSASQASQVSQESQESPTQAPLIQTLSTQTPSTIVGISTPLGVGAICIVRLSGEKALDFTLSLSKRKSLAPRHATLSAIYNDKGAMLDEAILLYFKAPHSYSGEDICEIHCHGGAVIARAVVDSLLALGAKPASAGEFSKRAFLNGRLDLAQVQAVAGLINSQSVGANEILLRQLRGELSNFVHECRDKLIELLAYSEANIDYSEEMDSDTSDAMRQKLENLAHKLRVLYEDSLHRQGMIEGFKICIVGKPNVGKSSLLNALLAYDRAITSPIAGTTRDSIEESLHIAGNIVRLIDTAGIRDCGDTIERIGIERAKKSLEQANLILALFDSSRALDSEDFALFDLLKNNPNNAHILLVLNKADMPCALDSKDFLYIEDFLRAPYALCKKPLSISTTHGKMQEFSELNPQQIFKVLEDFFATQEYQGDFLLTSKFQLECVQNALSALNLARQKLESSELELFSFHINECIACLSAITHPFEHSELLDKLFSTFCLGK